MSRLACLVLLGCVALVGCEGGRTERAFAPATGGDAERGRVLIHDIGCGACHVVPGVRGARGLVAPPLNAFARRSFIAGQLANAPEHLVRWLRDPQAVEPGTAMPNLDLDEQQARDIAAYLYTLQ